jgi:hypothetical protein
MNIFEIVTRNKIRFPYKGSASVEDLWDLPVEELDKLYRALNRQRKNSDEDSLLKPSNKVSSSLDIQIDIIKHIVETKETERVSNETSAIRSQEKQKILAIINAKKNEELSNKSIDELTEMVNSL